MLADDQAALVGSRAVLEIHTLTASDVFQGAVDDPKSAIATYENLTPYINCIRRLPEVGDAELVRRLASGALDDARMSADYERRSLAALQRGDHDYLVPGRSFEESADLTRTEIDVAEKRAATAETVLQLLPEGDS